MSIDHCGLQEFVAQQLLNRPDIVALFKQVGGKTVSQYMDRGLLCDPSFMHCILKFLLERGGMDMMASNHMCSRIKGKGA